jgi:hypothetical protein
MGWRDEYKVHPAADVFPMMGDDELAALGEDIKKNGQSIPILCWGKEEVLIDGRNRLEAMERIGIADQVLAETFHCKDPVTHIITLNIRRRHLTKQQQADLIVAAINAGEKPPQDEAVSKGGRGKVNPVKAKAIATAEEHGISKATVERSLAKANGRQPKPKQSRKPKPGTIIEVTESDDDCEEHEADSELPPSMRHRGFMACASQSFDAAEDAGHHIDWFAENAPAEIDDRMVDAAAEAARQWIEVVSKIEKARGRKTRRGAGNLDQPDR